MPKYHIAQVNVARLLAPLDDPMIADFVARLYGINALAERSPGFVWRLQSEGGNATDLRPFDDDRILVNMSVWESIEQLKEYVYRSAHAQVLKRRREWFEKFDGAFAAMWWIEAGHAPTVEVAKERLDHLYKHGESEFAFSFKKTFPPPQ
jgi:hypothetical protein